MSGQAGPCMGVGAWVCACVAAWVVWYGWRLGVGEWEHGLVLKINVQLADSLKFKSDPS